MAKTLNHDIVGIIQRWDRYATEMRLCVSANNSEFSLFDQARLADYLKNIDTYISWLTSQPDLDLVESSPREFTVDEPMADIVVESELVNDILRLMSISREEIINCQSNRRACGLTPADLNRFKAILLKLNTYLTDYVQANIPMDLPESSPLKPIPGAGKKGI